MTLIKIWQRRPGEPSLWYDRFERYRLEGASRSMLAIYNAEREENGKKRKAKSVPKPWRDAANEWSWKLRAEAWDEYERERTRHDYEADRRRARDVRMTTINALQALLGQVITSHRETRDTSVIKELAQAAATIMDQSRKEFGEPDTIIDVQSKGESIAPSMDSFGHKLKRSQELTDEWERAMLNGRKDGAGDD